MNVVCRKMIVICKRVTMKDTVTNKFEHRKTCNDQVKNPRPAYQHNK